MMTIGTIALDRSRHSRHGDRHRGLFLQAITESAFVGHNAVAGYAFALLVIAACFTSFYSWRLIFMTFHGKSRASEEVPYVHESPFGDAGAALHPSPLARLFAGFVFHDQFIGEAYEVPCRQPCPA